MDYGQVIYTTLLNDGIPPNLANIMTAQSKFESANYTSNVFLNCNNAFGYKYEGQAIAESCNISPEGDSYAGYDNVEDSAHEIAAWIGRRIAEGNFPADLRTITTPAQYAILLKQSGYFGAPLDVYTNGLTRFFKVYKAEVIAGGGIVVALVLGFYLYKHSKNL
jgi:uncharacterized FlgJ-related protein